MRVLTPWMMACRYFKIYKKIKHFPFNWRSLKNYVRNPHALLKKISHIDKNENYDSPELYAAKVSVVMDRFHLPYHVFVGKVTKSEIEPEKAETMFRNDECNAVWVEFDGKQYFSMGKSFKETLMYSPLYTFGELSKKHWNLNKLKARYFIDMNKSPKLLQPDEDVSLLDIEVNLTESVLMPSNKLKSLVSKNEFQIEDEAELKAVLTKPIEFDKVKTNATSIYMSDGKLGALALFPFGLAFSASVYWSGNKIIQDTVIFVPFKKDFCDEIYMTWGEVDGQSIETASTSDFKRTSNKARAFIKSLVNLTDLDVVEEVSEYK